MYLNRLSIMGFLGADGEKKSTAAGQTYTILSIATKTSWKDDTYTLINRGITETGLLQPLDLLSGMQSNIRTVSGRRMERDQRDFKGNGGPPEIHSESSGAICAAKGKSGPESVKRINSAVYRASKRSS